MCTTPLDAQKTKYGVRGKNGTAMSKRAARFRTQIIATILGKRALKVSKLIKMQGVSSVLNVALQTHWNNKGDDIQNEIRYGKCKMKTDEVGKSETNMGESYPQNRQSQEVI